MKLRSPRARRARALWLSRKRMLELKVDEDRYKMIDLQKHVAQVAVDVAAEGLVLPVVAFFAASAKELDKTIVRAFVARLADVAGPPFSDAFAGAVARLLFGRDVERAIRMASFTADQRASIAALVGGVAEHVGGAERAALDEIQKVVMR